MTNAHKIGRLNLKVLKRKTMAVSRIKPRNPVRHMAARPKTGRKMQGKAQKGDVVRVGGGRSGRRAKYYRREGTVMAVNSFRNMVELDSGEEVWVKCGRLRGGRKGSSSEG